MRKLALTDGRVLLGEEFRLGLSVIVEGARVAAVIPDNELPSGMARDSLEGGLLMPGFIDTQVNGGGGVLFNNDPTSEAIAEIGRAHRRFGTTAFLPTLISDDLATVRAAKQAVDHAITEGMPGVIGIHIEGPFLNVERKGIHDASKIRCMDDAALDLLALPGLGRTMVTLAPEKVAPAMIERLASAGVIVSGGHSNATAAQVFDALDHGLTGFTHLFNAMSQLGSREPGMVGAALYDERGWCGIVVDGRHVDPIVLQIAIRSTIKSRFMLVTDAMPSVGAAEKSFDLQGNRITVRDGVCMDEAGTLAGSDLDMASAVRNAVRMLGLSLAEAAAMASLNPAQFLGIGDEMGRIAPGYRADLVLMDDALDVVGVWIGGERQPANVAPAKPAL